MQDRPLICKDCGREFIFTVREQEFFKEKGFGNDPVRCSDCRKAKKQAQRGNDGHSGGGYGAPRNSGPSSNYGQPRRSRY
jgi:hypothetical protein